MNFTVVNIDWYQSTFFLYSFIILASYSIAKVYENHYFKVGSKVISVWLIFIGALLLFVKGFSTTGRDIRGGYYLNFLSSTSVGEFRDESIEIGYKLLSVILRNLSSQYSVFLFAVAILTLFPVLKFLKKYKNQIDIPLTVLFYVSVFFFSSLSPIRTCMAASIALFAFDGMIEKKQWKALLWIAISMCFHTSMVFLFIPYVFCFFKVFDKKLIVISLIAFFMLIYLGRNSLVSIFATSDRYYNYVLNSSASFGFEQWVYYAPLFLLIYLGRKKSDQAMLRVGFAYVTTAFCLGMLGYIMPVFGRTQPIFLAIIFIAGYYLKIVKQHYKSYSWLINILMIIYCIMRFWLYISQYYNLEDIMPYTNVWGWII
jgi:hypothetical protein